MNSHSLFSNNAAAPRESFHEAKYRDRPRCSLSNVSFYKQTTAGASRLIGNKKGVENRSIPPELVKREGMKVLLRYLSWQEYPEPISMLELQSPTRALLISLWNFILKRVDKNIEIDTKNANEEVPRIFKELGYPLAISKSSMVAPGTGHQWSHHLAALCWLCELLIYETEAFPGIADGADLRNAEYSSHMALTTLHGSTSLYNGQTSQHMFDKLEGSASASTACLNRIVAKNYVLCMTGREQKDNIKNAVLSQLEADAEAMKNGYERKANEMRGLQSNLQQMQQILDEHEQCGVRCVELENESKNLKGLTVEAQQQIPVIRSHLETVEQTLNSKLAEYEEQREIIKRLKETIAKQSMNKEEFQRLNMGVQESHETLQKHKETLEMCKTERDNVASEKNQLAQEIQPLCTRVNRKLTEIVSLGKRIKGSSLELWSKMKVFKFVAEAASLDSMLNLNWKEQKKRLQSAYKLDEEHLQKLMLDAPTMELQNSRTNIKFANEKLESKRNEETALKTSITELDKSKELSFKELQNQIEKKNTALENDKSKMNERYTMGQKRLEELESELQNQMESHFNECAAKWNKIQEMCKNLNKAKEISKQSFSQLANEKVANFEKFDTLLSPTLNLQ